MSIPLHLKTCIVMQLHELERRAAKVLTWLQELGCGRAHARKEGDNLLFVGLSADVREILLRA